MIYIGYQFNIEEAYRILGVPIDGALSLSLWKNVEILKEYCKSKTPDISISVYNIGRYCVFLGIEYEKINDVWKDHTTAGVCISDLLSIVQTIKNDLEILECDMSLVTMTYVEGEDYTVCNPEPVIINWEP